MEALGIGAATETPYIWPEHVTEGDDEHGHYIHCAGCKVKVYVGRIGTTMRTALDPRDVAEPHRPCARIRRLMR